MTTDQLLERIAIALEARTGKPQMGFVSSDMVYAWIGWEGTSACWYTRENDQNVPIKHSRVVGKLIGLKHKIKDFKGKAHEKLLIWLDCGDKKIQIESGLDTKFARSALLKLAALPASLIDQPITIAVNRGTEEGIVFCSIFIGGSGLVADWDDSISGLDLLKKCCAQLGFPSPVNALGDETRGALDKAITAEFYRLQKHGISIESLRAAAAKKFPGFTTSVALNSNQAYELLEMLKNVDIPL